jgi:hypothetical protein
MDKEERIRKIKEKNAERLKQQMSSSAGPSDVFMFWWNGFSRRISG